jgi:hypothetical protein
MASVGQFNTLVVRRETASGYYLDGGLHGEILLPGKLAPKDLAWGSSIEVFVYPDSEDRLVATTEKPHATVGQFAALEVISVHPRIGAFLDWGLSKDLLLPFREQREERAEEGDTVVVYVVFDERSERVIATTRWQRYLRKSPPRYAPGAAVECMVSHRTPLGFVLIVEGEYLGMLYHSNLGTALEPGKMVTAYVQTVRGDGKIDLRLDPKPSAQVWDLSAQILAALEASGGHLPFDDFSTPESIRETFGTSKKTFKKVLSTLYRERRIQFPEEGGITWGEKGPPGI